MDNSQNNVTFFDVFSFLCRIKNVTQKEAVKAIDISTGTINNWKTGAMPYESTMIRIAEYFGIEYNAIKNIFEGLNWKDESVRQDYIENWRKIILNCFPETSISEFDDDLLALTPLEKLTIKNTINEIRLKLDEIENIIDR